MVIMAVSRNIVQVCSASVGKWLLLCKGLVITLLVSGSSLLAVVSLPNVAGKDDLIHDIVIRMIGPRILCIVDGSTKVATRYRYYTSCFTCSRQIGMGIKSSRGPWVD